MTKDVKQTASITKRYAKLGVYNVSILSFGYSLVQTAYGNYKYALHYNGLQYRLAEAASVLIGALGIYVFGKWLVNKELEIK